MIRFAVLIATASVAVLSQTAAAADPVPVEKNGFEATLFGGYRMGGSFETKPIADTEVSVKRDLADEVAYGLTLNWEAAAGGYYELLYTRQDSELEQVRAGDNIPQADAFDLSVEYLHIGGMLEFGEPAARVIPYFALTIGATRLTPDDERNSETDFSLGLGGGVKVPIGKHFAVRLDLRGYITWLDSDSDIFCISTGATSLCNIRVHGDNFIQAQAGLGFTAGF